MFGFDDKFIKKLIQKDKNSFNEFYLKTVDIFFRYIKSNYFFKDADAQDLISSFYFKLWNVLELYNDWTNFSSRVWTIFRNMLKDYFKKSRDIPFSDMWEENNDFGEWLESDKDIREFLEIDFEFNQIKSAMKKLDEVSSEIIFLKFIEERKNDEICKMLWISQDNVRQRLSRAIKKLKKLLWQ